MFPAMTHIFNIRRVFLTLTLLFSLAAPASGQVHDMVPRAPKELLVRFKENIAELERNKLLTRHGTARSLRMTRRNGLRAHAAIPSGLRHTRLLKLQTDEQVETALAELSRNPAVESVEPNQPLRLFNVEPRFPNDFEFENLYGLHNTGKHVGTPGADIKAPEAWTITTGSKNVIVAVIDTGIDYFHEDLRDNIWTNQDEIPGNGLDDDRNGYIDDFYGYDFVTQDQDPMDDHMHGTHVAGTIGARGDNQIGVVGVCWEVSLMALKAFDERGGGTLAEALEAIDYAIANGARVINASWGVGEKSRALEDAMLEAEKNGVLIVAAAGNERTDDPAFPASIETVLAVAATDASDFRAGFSNHGNWVDLSAPGADILSTVLDGDYDRSSGTSMAAPHVTGVAALLLSKNPQLSPPELRSILVNTTDFILADTFRITGSGRLNAYNALRVSAPLPIASLTPQKTIQGMVQLHGTAAGPDLAGYALWGGKGIYPTNWQLLATSSIPITNGLLAAFDSSTLGEGGATLRLNVSNTLGGHSVEYLRLRVQNFNITSPRSGDILRPGGIHQVRGTIFGPITSYEIQYGQGLEPISWTNIAQGGPINVVDGPLAQWDTTALPPDLPYALRIVARSATETNIYVAPAITFDSTLRPGWPQYLRISDDLPRSDWRNIRAADLDNDSRQELVLLDSADANGTVLKVFSLSGELLWSRKLPDGDPRSDLPVFADLDGDGPLETIVDVAGQVLVFSASGEEWRGNWPLQFPGRNAGKAVADLDGDGRSEIVMLLDPVVSRAEDQRELRVYNNQGELMRLWSTPTCAHTNDVQEITPAIANLDADSAREIVTPWGCGEIARFDFANTNAPSWTTPLTGRILVGAAIGDVDANGENDIVVVSAALNGRGGVYLLDADGNVQPGWPALESESFLTAPALGDCDGDGKLEILVANSRKETLHLLLMDGFDAEGWPIEVPSMGARNGVSLFDFTGNGLPEIVLTSVGYTLLAINTKEVKYWGGIRAFTMAGKQLNLGPAEVLPVEGVTGSTWHKTAPAIITDLDRNGKVDLVTTSIQDRTYGLGATYKSRSTIYVRELDFPYVRATNQWAMLGADLQNTSHLPIFPAAFPEPTDGPTRALTDRLGVREDTSLEIDPLLNDIRPENASLTLLSAEPTTNGVLSISNNRILYTPNSNFFGLDQFTYLIEGSDRIQSTGRIKVFVKPVADPPTVPSQALTMNRNTSVDVFYSGLDPDGDPLTYRIPRAPGHGELWNYPTIGNYVPAFGYSGPDNFTIVASDGKFESPVGLIEFNITNTNNPPKAQSQSLTIRTNQSLIFNLKATDADKDPVSFIITTEPANGSLAPSGSAYLYQPRPGFYGIETVKFRATDGVDSSTEAEVRIKVTDENTAPLAHALTLKVARNATNEIVLTGSDPEGTTLSFAIAAQPTRGRLVGDPPRLAYVPAANFTGPDRFSFTVSDGVFTSQPALVSLKVGSGNLSPSLDSTAFSGKPGTPLAFHLKASDPEDDPLTIVILKGTRFGRLVGTGTNLVYQPQPLFTGQDYFTARLWDGSSYSAEKRIDLFIQPDPPPLEVSFTSLAFDKESGAWDLLLSVPKRRLLQILSSSDLLEWTLETSTMTDESGQFRFLDPARTPELKFYRATVQ